MVCYQRGKMMPRYNLLDEKWIQVVSKDTVEKISIKELFLTIIVNVLLIKV